jgi:hypothetical protein
MKVCAHLLLPVLLMLALAEVSRGEGQPDGEGDSQT